MWRPGLSWIKRLLLVGLCLACGLSVAACTVSYCGQLCVFRDTDAIRCVLLQDGRIIIASSRSPSSTEALTFLPLIFVKQAGGWVYPNLDQSSFTGQWAWGVVLNWPPRGKLLSWPSFEHYVGPNAYGRPSHRTWVALPAWSPAAAFALPLGAYGARRWRVAARTRRRRRQGQCLDCGYDLRGGSDRCPECGAVRVRAEL